MGAEDGPKAVGIDLVVVGYAPDSRYEPASIN